MRTAYYRKRAQTDVGCLYESKALAPVRIDQRVPPRRLISRRRRRAKREAKESSRAYQSLA